MVKLLDGGFRHVHMNSKGFEKSQSKENCLRQYSPTCSDLSSCFTPNIVPINSPGKPHRTLEYWFATRFHPMILFLSIFRQSFLRPRK